MAAQSLQEEFEIICIDDGSTDDTPELLAAYASERGNLRSYKQENGGIASARNAGLALARGSYIMFVDNDDALYPTMLEETIAAARRENADIVSTGRVEVNEATGKRAVIMASEEVVIEGPMGARLVEFDGYVWGKLINRELFAAIQFPQGYWYEDMITRLLLYRMCNKFVLMARPLYVKYAHSDNASENLWSGRSTRSLDQVNLIEEMAAKAESLGLTWDEGAFLAFLYEAGPMLHSRTRGLSRALRREAFMTACRSVHKRQGTATTGRLSRGGSAFAHSVSAGDFLLWELAGWYWVIASDRELLDRKL